MSNYRLPLNWHIHNFSKIKGGKNPPIREVNGQKSEETPYYISSRNLEIGEFAKAVRGHRSIENCLHWVLDIVFKDDESRGRTRHASANFVTLKHITLNMLKKVNEIC